MKRALIIALSILMLFTAVVIPASAQVPETVQPRWTNIYTYSASLDFANYIGYVSASVCGLSETTTVMIDVVVYQYYDGEWWYLTEEHIVQNSISASHDFTFNPVAATEYKAEFTFTAIKDGTNETISETVITSYDGT